MKSILYQGYSLKSARLTKEVQYVIDTWNEYAVSHIWTGYRGPCYEKAKAEGKLDLLSSRLIVWMMEGLRPECIKSDLLAAIAEIGEEYLETVAKLNLSAWIHDIENLLVFEPPEECIARVFQKLRNVVTELKAFCLAAN